MKTMTLYVVGEFLKVFFVALAIITLFFIVAVIVKEGLKKGLDLVSILRLIPYILPDALRFSIPGTTLFAVCTVFGRMASSNELVALKSLGISPMAAIRPILVLTAGISLLTVFLNDLAVSWGRRGMQRVVIESVEEIAYGMLRSHKSYSTGRFSIGVKTVRDRRLILPVVVFRATEEKPEMTVRAREARLQSNLSDNTLKITFVDGTILVGDDYVGRFPGTEEIYVSLSDASRAADGSVDAGTLSQWEIPAARIAQRERINRREQQMAAEATFRMLSGDFEALGSRATVAQLQALATDRFRLHKLEAERHRRWSDGLVCVCFAMVGAPVAIMRRKSDFLASFFACFLPILVLYYPLLAFGLNQAKSGNLPAYCVWLPNLALATCGVALLRRVMRY